MAAKLIDLISQLLMAIIMLICVCSIWRALDQLDAKSDRMNETLEAIRKQLDNEELWQSANESIKNNSR